MDKKTAMENYVREAHEKGVFTGTWLLAENGALVSKGAIGYFDAADSRPMREDTLFDIGSVSKQFTAAAIMLLRRRGLLSLDDEIRKFFPGIPYKGVTVRNLLTHTGGLPDNFAFIRETAKKEGSAPDNGATLRFFEEGGEEPRFEPGEAWEYCNSGYSLLALLTEKLSGTAFADFLKKNIFEPAGMASTGLYHRIKDGAEIENLAVGLTYEGDNWLPAEDSMWKSLVVSLDGTEGAGFVKSNIFDLCAWDRALRDGKVLTKEEQELMFTPAKLKNGEIGGGGYGFGFGIFEQEGVGHFAWHEGEWPGYRAWFGHFLDTDRVMVILCSRTGFDERGMEAFFNGMLLIALGHEPEPVTLTEDLAEEDPDRSAWESFCGEYDGEPEGLMIKKVYMKDKELFASIYSVEADGTFEAKLYPFGGNTFGIKGDSDEIEFGDGSLSFGDEFKKIS
ncbi:MAG: beta-lactamase family protein [Clostridia bacterium]|nr:beta-lactamase family protein [Clostridia bacterium]